MTDTEILTRIKGFEEEQVRLGTQWLGILIEERLLRSQIGYLVAELEGVRRKKQEIANQMGQAGMDLEFR